jgi:hypothetical protein
MERLNVHQVEEIIYSLRSGQSERSIARAVGFARYTGQRARLPGMRRILRAFPPCIFPPVQIEANGQRVNRRSNERIA